MNGDDQDTFAPAPPPNAPTSAGAMYVSPTAAPALTPDQQTALQARMAGATAGPARAITPPGGGGVPLPDLGSMYRAAFSRLPVDQASKAIEAAVRYQGQRGYQLDMQNGMPADRAMVKWGPLLFHSAPGALSAAMRNAMSPQQPTGPIQAQPILDEKGQPIPGQYAFRQGNRVERVQSGMTEAQRVAHEDRQAALKAAGEARQESLSSRARGEKLMALRQQEKELSNDPFVTADISPKATPERRKAIQAKKDRLAKVQQGIDEIIAGMGAVPGRKATTAKTVRVKDPAGKTGTIPEDQLDDALAAGYEEIK